MMRIVGIRPNPKTGAKNIIDYETTINTYEELVTKPKDIVRRFLASYPSEEAVNLFYVAADIKGKDRKAFIKQQIIPFDLDKIDYQRIPEYLDIFTAVTEISWRECFVVTTGNGLQIVVRVPWFEEEDFKRYRPHYHVIMDKICKECQDSELPIEKDTSVWKATQFLRLPCTINRKDGQNKHAKAYNKATTVHLFPWERFAPPPIEKKEKKEEYEEVPVNLPYILKECTFLKEQYETGGANANYQQWFAMIGVAAYLDKDGALCHKMSEKYAGYKFEETEKLYQSTIDRTDAPTTCLYISGSCTYCTSCRHWGSGIGTPKNLRPFVPYIDEMELYVAEHGKSPDDEYFENNDVKGFILNNSGASIRPLKTQGAKNGSDNHDNTKNTRRVEDSCENNGNGRRTDENSTKNEGVKDAQINQQEKERKSSENCQGEAGTCNQSGNNEPQGPCNESSEKEERPGKEDAPPTQDPNANMPIHPTSNDPNRSSGNQGSMGEETKRGEEKESGKGTAKEDNQGCQEISQGSESNGPQEKNSGHEISEAPPTNWYAHIAAGFTNKRLTAKGTVKLERDVITLVDYMTHKHHYKTIAESTHVYAYKEGAYYPFPKAEIMAFAQTHYRPVSTTSRDINEFYNKVIIHNLVDETFLTPSRPGHVNLANGVLQIKTGKLLPHCPSYGFLYKLPYDYSDKEDCPVWDQLMQNVCSKDQERIDAIEEFLGYCAYGGKYEYAKALVLAGDGENGKSTVINIMSEVLGTENCSSVVISEMVNNKFLGYNFVGKLANFDEEDDRCLRRSENLKKLTGNSPIHAEKKREQGFSFCNTAKIILSYNKVPRLDDDSHGTLRRLLIIPFELRLDKEPDKKIPHIMKKIKPELCAILLKCLKKFAMVMERGEFTMPKAGKIHRDNIVMQSNDVYEWAELALQITGKKKDHKVINSELFNDFMFQAKGVKITQAKFTRALIKYFENNSKVEYGTFKGDDGKTKRGFRGVIKVNE